MNKLGFGMILISLFLLNACSKTDAEIPSSIEQTTSTEFTLSSIPTQTGTVTATITSTPTITPTPFLPATPTATLIPTQTPDPNFSQFGPGPVLFPILLYHHVLPVNENASQYAVTVDQFKTQMVWMQENGYRTIKVQDMVDAIHVGKLLPNKPFIITFDDGNVDIYNYAYPILKDLGFTATMYLIEEAVGDYGNFSVDIIHELADAGWEFGSHTKNHANLNTCADRTDEICGSRDHLIEMLQIPIQSIAYPFGIENDREKTIAFGCGYTSGAGLGSFTIHTQDRLFYFSRREIKSYFDMQRFITTVTDVR